MLVQEPGHGAEEARAEVVARGFRPPRAEVGAASMLASVHHVQLAAMPLAMKRSMQLSAMLNGHHRVMRPMNNEEG